MTSKDDTMEAYVDGHAVSLSLPVKAWVAKGDQACPCCGSPLTGDCAIAASHVGEDWLRSYTGKKYGCGSVFVFSTVKRGLLVLMYNTPPVCMELEDESEDSI